MTVWSAYEYQPSFILGFHGCDRSTAEKILSGQEEHLLKSEKAYDWLGSGIYFWEGSPRRALEWANARKDEGKISHPYVLGAIIDLRHCLDLFDREGLEQVKMAHREMLKVFRLLQEVPPKNVGRTPDKAGRKLDCAVLNYLHWSRRGRKLQAYDSVRAPFLEGPKLYPGAGFRSQNHIQICVRDTACIKGYFRPFGNGHVATQLPA